MRIHLRIFFFIAISLIILSAPSVVKAHAPNQSYVFFYIYEDGIDGIIEITTDDINRALNLSLSREISLEDLNTYLPQIQEFVLKNVSFKSVQGSHAISFNETTLFSGGSIGNYVQLHFSLDGLSSVPDKLDISYDILFNQDPTHQGLIVIAEHWKGGIVNNEAMVSLILDADERNQTLEIAEGSLFKGFTMMVGQGIHHIWIGIDHILFLLALILPSVLKSMYAEKKSPEVPTSDSGFLSNLSNRWKPVESFKPAFIYILKIVTFFTIAHTITLSLAALEIVSLPSRIVESIIALSIALAALHNIYPIFKGKDWIIAFGFGLFHGFGFASVLGDIGLGGQFLSLTLFGFNVGVEVGQILIICLIFPVLYLIRNWKWYPQFLFSGSILLILISLYWFIERFFEVDILLGKFVFGLVV